MQISSGRRGDFVDEYMEQRQRLQRVRSKSAKEVKSDFKHLSGTENIAAQLRKMAGNVLGDANLQAAHCDAKQLFSRCNWAAHGKREVIIKFNRAVSTTVVDDTLDVIMRHCTAVVNAVLDYDERASPSAERDTVNASAEMRDADNQINSDDEVDNESGGSEGVSALTGALQGMRIAAAQRN